MAAITQARADSVQFPGFAHGSQPVTFSVSTPNVAKMETASAGGFSPILNGGPTFESYCFDLYQTINFGAPPYTGYGPPGMTHVFANSRAYTLCVYRSRQALCEGPGLVNNSVTEAAFQIEVWEIAYETPPGPYDLGHGAATSPVNPPAPGARRPWLRAG
jgi:hypothetical protein